MTSGVGSPALHSPFGHEHCPQGSAEAPLRSHGRATGHQERPGQRRIWNNPAPTAFGVLGRGMREGHAKSRAQTPDPWRVPTPQQTPLPCVTRFVEMRGEARGLPALGGCRPRCGGDTDERVPVGFGVGTPPGGHGVGAGLEGRWHLSAPEKGAEAGPDQDTELGRPVRAGGRGAVRCPPPPPTPGCGDTRLSFPSSWGTRAARVSEGVRARHPTPSLSIATKHTFTHIQPLTPLGCAVRWRSVHLRCRVPDLQNSLHPETETQRPVESPQLRPLPLVATRPRSASTDLAARRTSRKWDPTAFVHL